MKLITLKLSLAAASAFLLAGGLAWAGAASSASAAPATAAPQSHRDEPLVAAYEQVSQNTTWTLARSLPATWAPAGVVYEWEGMKVYQGRIYLSVFDHTDNDGHLVVLDQNTGDLIKDISFADGDRTHAGGMDVYGDYAYVPLAVDSPHSSADILRINIHTFQVTNLFTVGYDHVGGLTYDPATHLIVGQDWDSRTFYEWTTTGKIVSEWNNPSDYVGYQDCQYVRYNKLLCSGATEGATTIGGFDLIDLSDPEHAILNGVPNVHGGNAAEILAAPVTGGTQLTLYAAGSMSPVDEYTTVIPDAAAGASGS